jgi:hypothetical protein
MRIIKYCLNDLGVIAKAFSYTIAAFIALVLLLKLFV